MSSERWKEVDELGAQLGPYRIEALLGAGGMGQVFRGIDTRLDRPVAIKIVSEEFSHQFEREARAISSLNHPHICTLYDVGSGYLVMELVEGETLAARLQRGRMPIDTILRYGAEIADALAAAHTKGIIHRDLKPGNLMATKSGIKVLDFGLARITQPDETVTASQLIQGTPAYMAPEQFEGKPCDARTDIYALGLVLYELATGKRLKQDESPNLENLPERFAHVVERCLTKEPDDRWQSARDVRAELAWAGKSHAAPVPVKPTRPWSWVVGLMAGAAFVLVGAAVLNRVSQPVSSRPARFILSFDQQTLDPLSMPSPSPDGRYFAFVASSAEGPDMLWLRPLDAVESRRLPGTEGARTPFWSPDGRWIGFFADGKLKKIDPSGGPPRNIASVPRVEDATWGANGEIVYRPGNRTPLYRIHESGGSPQQLTRLDRSRAENSHRSPVFLPEGRRFLFTTRCSRREHNALYIGSVDSPDVRRLMPVQSNVKYVPPRDGSPGVLLYYRDSMLVAQPFDADSEKAAGDAEPVIENVAYYPSSATASFEVSTAGNLMILRTAGASETRLTWFNRMGEEIGVIGPRGDYFQPRLSPNADRIAFVRADRQTGNRDVWSVEIARGVAARLTTDEANDWFPNWSRDGREMVFGSDREGGTDNAPYIKKSMDPGAQESRLPYNWEELGAAYDPAPFDWSRDGRWVAMGSFDIWVAPISGDSKPFPFLATPFNEGGARFSPDGKWIAYVSDETGRVEVYVRPFAAAPAAGEGKMQISNAGGTDPVWRADGRELFYRSSDRHLYAANSENLSRTGAAPVSMRLFRPCPDTEIFSPRMLFQPWTYQYDSRDGQRFIVNYRAEPQGQFIVLMNWMAGRRSL